MRSCHPVILASLHVVSFRQRFSIIYTNLISLRHCPAKLLTFYFISTLYALAMSTPEETSQLKAGHPPAVKAGGMRITQHKVPHTKDANEKANEDLTGLGGPSAVPTNPISIAGAPNRGNADFTPQAAQVAHSPKPAAYVNVKPCPNIQQPRK